MKMKSQKPSYSWYLLNKNGEVELFSGFNGFYAVGSKMSKEYKEKRYKDLYKKYKNVIPENILKDIYSFLFDASTTKDLKIQKSNLRSSIIKNIKKLNQRIYLLTYINCYIDRLMKCISLSLILNIFIQLSKFFCKKYWFSIQEWK